MRKSSNPGDVLFMIAFLGITAAGMAISMESPAAIQGDHESWAVKAGDDLTYEVSGHRNGAPVIGAAYANFTVVNVTAVGDTVGGFFSTDLGNWAGRGVESALSSPSMGSCIGQEAISTHFGHKHVTRCISYTVGDYENASTFTVVYAGVESRIIYRINVSGPSFFLTCELEGCPVDDISGLDVHAMDGLAINLPRPNGAYTETYGVHGATSIGVWDLPEGTIFNHSLEGNGSAFFCFNKDNIDHMEHGGVIEFDPELSVLDPPGVRSKVFEGGLCMVVTIATSTTGETTEQFDLRYPS